MKKIILLFFSFIIISYCYSQEGWFQQSFGPSHSINMIFFIDDNTGWAAYAGTNGFVSNGFLKRTTDGGANWNSSMGGPIAFQDIHYINNQTGWVVGNFGDDVGNRSRNIFKSTNSGVNYIMQYVDSLGPYFVKVYAVDPSIVICIKNNGDVFRSSNGGLNWSITNLPPILLDMKFNNNTGWILGGLSRLYKTTNNGINWNLISQLSAIYPESFHFINETTGYVCDENLYKTINGGINWFVVSQIGVYAKKVFFINEMRGWATGTNGTIRFTSNGGLNWMTQNPGGNYQSITINCIQFLNPNTGWCSGSGLLMYPNYLGLILKTTNGGITGFNPISTEIPEEFSLAQNYPNPFNPVTNIKFSLLTTHYTIHNTESI